MRGVLLFWVLLGGFCPIWSGELRWRRLPRPRCCFREPGWRTPADELPAADTSLIEVFVNSESHDRQARRRGTTSRSTSGSRTTARSTSTSTPTLLSARRCARRASGSARRSRARSTVPRSPPSATSRGRSGSRATWPRTACRRRHQARGQVVVRPPADRHPARQQVHERRRHVPLRRGAQQGDRAHRRQQRLHRPDARRSRSPAPTVSTARPPTWAASSTPTRRRTSTCITVSSSAHGRAAAIPASQMTVRVAASTGAVDTYKVTEWLGTELPPNVAGYQKGFFTRYQDPTENRAQLDTLAAAVPEPGHAGQPAEPDGRLPAQVAGDHVRHERHRLGPARHDRRPADRHHGRDHGRAAGRQHPVHATAGQTVLATVDGIPSG